ncbi:MAG: aminoacyl-tRNA hydrolase [Treponemataceae bacterium]|nr:aminoacyl-tRNA hydrolase [Treponemataceae bacterium]
MNFAWNRGKSGNNVNKVHTKVHLVLPITKIEGLTDEECVRLRDKLCAIINSNDCIYPDADEELTQKLNRKNALSRLENRIENALKITKKRKKTKPTQVSKELCDKITLSECPLRRF